MKARATGIARAAAIALIALAVSGPSAASEGEKPREIVYRETPAAPAAQTRAEAETKSAGCRSCHTATDAATMHASPAVVLGCTDCHGGDASVFLPAGVTSGRDEQARVGHEASSAGHGSSGHGAVAEGEAGEHQGPAYDPAYLDVLERAHVLPRYPHAWNWPSSATPERTYTLLNREAPEFIRFVNPGDLRVARESCGNCHLETVEAVERSLMAHMAMFWGGAAYNNGILPFKRSILGEAYTREGLPASVSGPPGDDTPEAARRSRGPQLFPMPAWETVPPGDNFRVFERGGRNIASTFPEIGLPNPLEEPGRPDIRQSLRGPGTGSRVSIPVLNIHKTRLNDPALWFLGTNDQPGDYRSSGCTSCHVVYANDRDPIHSGPAAAEGHDGTTRSEDPTIPRDEPGHPLKHSFTRAIPTSQCMVCHMHQPNMFLNSYLGYTMWDYEADAPLMFPAEQKKLDHEELFRTHERNPEGASPRGKWSDLEFLKKVWTDVNPEARMTQFADYHGHGWNFRAIFKRDRSGRLLDEDGGVVANEDPAKFGKAVHLRDIHAEKGMHCVDCHYSRDSHGTGHIALEVAAAVEIRCANCHGTVDEPASLVTNGPAAPEDGTPLGALRNPDGRLRFEWRDGVLWQRSLLWPDREWKVPQVRDSVTEGHPDYNPSAARAKTVRRDGAQGWGGIPDKEQRAHRDDNMACFSCHSAWVTSCGGCHLPINANRKTERHHFEGGETRNYATYNPQVARDDIFMLGRHGDVKDHIIAPLRSSSALVVSSSDINRNHIYVQQPPIAASGYSSQAINPHFPHTVRKTETKGCEDCHLSAEGDNNAIMAQLLGLGTRTIDLLGFTAWVGTEGGLEGVQVTEWEEPQAVLGSYLHRYAYPAEFQRHLDAGRELSGGKEVDGGAATHRGGTTRCLQARGEYLYAAEGAGGLRVYDIANVANKGFSQRVVSAPFSSLGQDIRVESADATCVVLPTTQPVRFERNGGKDADPEHARLMFETNREQPMHPVYRYAAVTDAREGLILVDIVTMGDSEPRNNFLERAMTWNPGGLLDGAVHATFAGHLLYVAASAGVVVVDLDDPLHPRHLATLAGTNVNSVFLQFRYLFVTDASGLRVADVTDPASPRWVEGAVVAMADARRLFVARTYAYVAAGAEGLVIVDVEKPERPRRVATFGAAGGVVDARDVSVAMTNGSLFAYVADGTDGLDVVQLTSPDSQPDMYGFSPEPRPEAVAHYRTRTPALALSRALERDRAVDETGHQVAVFGRIGSRPFNLEEMRAFFLDDEGRPWTVRNNEEQAR
jgi:hypothetical protein